MSDRRTGQHAMSERERLRLREQHRSWVSMILVQMAYGSAIGLLTGYLMVHYNIANLGTLVARSSSGWSFTILLMFGFASLTGPIAAGFAIWLRADREARQDGET